MLFGTSNSLASRFNSRGILLSSLKPADEVEPTIRYVNQSGGTNIADGLREAFSAFSNNNTPKVAILITDGKSNEAQARKLLEEADKKNITIYTIGLGDKNKLNKDLLKLLAHETGGQYYHAKENIDISEIYTSILSGNYMWLPSFNL